MFNGDPDKARGALERAVQLDKTAADPHMALAQIYGMQGHDSQAKRHIETYRRLAPKARQSDKGHHHSQVDEAGARSQPQGR